MTNSYNVNAKEDTPTKDDFFSHWEHIIQTTKNARGRPITSGTIKSKKGTLTLIKEYCEKQKFKLTFQGIDINFYHAFDAFMLLRGLNDNTRGKHFKEIKAILREAEDRDIPVNGSYRKKSFKVIRIQPDNVYLNEAEIRKIYDLTLTAAKSQLRDIFVMACFVGARHCDWNKINSNNVIKENSREFLKYKDTKTGKIVHLPIHPVVKKILTKYNGTPPAVITNQKFNEALKEICRDADLGNVTIDNTLQAKWREITTHTARRSFATNAYLSKSLDVHQIMQCTGHSTESSFLRYLKLDGKDYAIQAAESKFFTDNTWTLDL